MFYEPLTSQTIPTAVPFTFQECKTYTRFHAKSFYFASFLLPKEKRQAAYAVYAFCRFADDIIDRAVESHDDRNAIFLLLRGILDELYDPLDTPGAPVGAFTQTVRKYGIPKKHFLALLDGVTTDIETDRYQTFKDLYDYCFKVAGVVGLIMCDIFGYSNPFAHCYGEDLGTAMQLTNILRDIREDAAMNRVYLPQADLDRFGCTEEDIMQGVMNDEFRALMRFQIDRARMYYRRSAEGIQYLTNDGSRTTVVLMNKIYSAILDEIERSGYDVFSRRHHVHLGKKLWMYFTYKIRPDKSLAQLLTPGKVEGSPVMS